ncbi:hypothetical protein [Streptomyces mirabilis]|uniref:hypothetical protein n=1 Tax=Streptomyces mirabilis TaxID=68239 RepID=UPI0036DA6856
MSYAIFDTLVIHGIPGIEELAQAGREMVPPLVIAPAQLLQVLDDSCVTRARRSELTLLNPASAELDGPWFLWAIV